MLECILGINNYNATITNNTFTGLLLTLCYSIKISCLNQTLGKNKYLKCIPWTGGISNWIKSKVSLILGSIVGFGM